MARGLLGIESSSVRYGDYTPMAMAALVVAVCALLAASGTASARLMASDFERGIPLIVGLVLLFLMNLPINVFWYSAFVLVLSRAKMLDFTTTPAFSGSTLANKVLGAAVCVSAMGALIDMFASGDDTTWIKEIGEVTVVALALVFASVVVASMAIPRLKGVPSIVIAAAIAFMNLVHWIVIAEVFYGGADSENPAPFIVAYGLICAVLSVVTYVLISRIEPSDACSVAEPGEEA